MVGQTGPRAASARPQERKVVSLGGEGAWVEDAGATVRQDDESERMQEQLPCRGENKLESALGKSRAAGEDS